MPGRAFTRGMYSRLKLKDSKGRDLKPHHHIWLNKQFVADCHMWERFLATDSCSLWHPFIDFDPSDRNSQTLGLYSNASCNGDFGWGAVFLEENRWIGAQWPKDFVENCQPSIEYLELYALVAAVLTWSDTQWMSNRRVTIFCDNESVVYMVNNSASSCMQCMKLLRILTLDNIRANRRVFVQHVPTKQNSLAVAISRMNFKKFWSLAADQMKPTPDLIEGRLLGPQELFLREVNYLPLI